MINAVSVVNVLAAGGLAVEFCLHIMIKYIRSPGTKEERISTALNTMGSTVFIGIFLTKLIGKTHPSLFEKWPCAVFEETGVSILSLASSQIFKVYYFRMYISIVILGAFYGLLVLPAILMVFGAAKDPSRISGASYISGGATGGTIAKPGMGIQTTLAKPEGIGEPTGGSPGQNGPSYW